MIMVQVQIYERHKKIAQYVLHISVTTGTGGNLAKSSATVKIINKIKKKR